MDRGDSIESEENFFTSVLDTWPGQVIEWFVPAVPAVPAVPDVPAVPTVLKFLPACLLFTKGVE